MKSYIQSLEVLWNKLIQNSILLHAVMSSQNNANVHQLLCKCTSSPHVAGRIDLVRSKTAQVFDTKVNSVSIQLTDNVAVWTLLGNGRSIFFTTKTSFTPSLEGIYAQQQYWLQGTMIKMFTSIWGVQPGEGFRYIHIS